MIEFISPILMTGYPKIIEMLINAGANINAVDNDKDTALHIAAIKGAVSSVKELLLHGANIKAENNAEKTPFDVARNDGNSFFIEKKAASPILFI